MDQKSAGIKVATSPAPSRGFALWVILLLLYFLLLPSAAETGASGASAQARVPVPSTQPVVQRAVAVRPR